MHFSMHSQYSSRLNTSHANTDHVPLAMIVETMGSQIGEVMQEQQRTSAPSAAKVSIRIALSLHITREQEIRVPESTLSWPNLWRYAIKPCNWFSTQQINVRPNWSSFTLYSWPDPVFWTDRETCTKLSQFPQYQHSRLSLSSKQCLKIFS